MLIYRREFLNQSGYTADEDEGVVYETSFIFSNIGCLCGGYLIARSCIWCLHLPCYKRLPQRPSSTAMGKDCATCSVKPKISGRSLLLRLSGRTRNIVSTKTLFEKRPGEKVGNLYTSFSEKEREGLKLSFQTQVYDIDYKPNEARTTARMLGLRENLQYLAQGY